MADDSLVPYRAEPPAPRPNRLPAPPGRHVPVPPGRHPPVSHGQYAPVPRGQYGPVPQPPPITVQPGAIEWGAPGPSREECWQRLSPGVQRRVYERVGTWLDWWATDRSGRVDAVVLGTRALVVVTPTVNAAGRPVYELVTVHLRESSFRSAPIHAPGVPPQPPTAADASVLSAGSRRLDETVNAFLRVLPVRAQVLLQEPFLADARPLQRDWYAYATGDVQSLEGASVRVWCYLTDRRVLTFLGGIGHGYVEGVGARRWELTCWRAEATPRRGAGTNALVPT